MTPEQAWSKAMSFEHRPNPYPFFDELRKTPVVHVGKGLYVVTGYRELLTLTQDPRVSSAPNPLAARPAAEQEGVRAGVTNLPSGKILRPRVEGRRPAPTNGYRRPPWPPGQEEPR